MNLQRAPRTNAASRFYRCTEDFRYLISSDLITRKHGREDATAAAALCEYIEWQDIVVDVRGIEAIYQADVGAHQDGETFPIRISRTYETDDNPSRR